MNSVVEISGFAGMAMLAAPLLLLVFALFLALLWPVVAGPVPPETAPASDLVQDRGEPSLKSDQIGTHGLEGRAEQEADIFYTPGAVTSKNNGMARDESASPLSTKSPHNDVQTRPLPVPDAADIDLRAVQVRDLLTKALDLRAAGDDVSAAEHLREFNQACLDHPQRPIARTCTFRARRHCGVRGRSYYRLRALAVGAIIVRRRTAHQ